MPKNIPLEAEADVLSVYQVFVTKGIIATFGDSNSDCLVFIRRGRGACQISRTEIVIRERQVILLPAGRTANLSAADDPAIAVMVKFDPARVLPDPRLAEFYVSLRARWCAERPLAIAEAGQAINVISTLRAMVRDQNAGLPEAPLLLRARFFDLLGALSRELGRSMEAEALDDRARRFQRSLRHLEDHIGGEISVAGLARVAGMSYRRYTQVFRREMGTSVLAYVRALRVRLAKERLLETGEVLQASLDAGFADLSNFYRVFRLETGLTPKQFIGRNGGNSPIITL